MLRIHRQQSGGDDDAQSALAGRLLAGIRARRNAIAAARSAVPVSDSTVVGTIVLQRDFLNQVVSAPGGGVEIQIVRDADGGLRLYLPAAPSHTHPGTECTIDESGFTGPLSGAGCTDLQALADFLDTYLTPP